MGVQVGRNERGWEASVCEVELTGEGRRVFGVENLVSVPPFCAYDGGNANGGVEDSSDASRCRDALSAGCGAVGAFADL